jgi:hypothetical protein
MDDSDVLIRLANLREDLKEFLKPEILSKLVDLIEDCGPENGMLERYKWFCNNSDQGKDCRHAAMAKRFFFEDKADKVAKDIIWLYESWAKFYK